MAIPIEPQNIYTIVSSATAYIPMGAICYLQLGESGTPKGLLLSLTNTPVYSKVIKTNNGFQRII